MDKLKVMFVNLFFPIIMLTYRVVVLLTKTKMLNGIPKDLKLLQYVSAMLISCLEERGTQKV